MSVRRRERPREAGRRGNPDVRGGSESSAPVTPESQLLAMSPSEHRGKQLRGKTVQHGKNEKEKKPRCC